MRKTLAALLFGALIPAAATAKNLYIPAASYSPGANGTYWRTDVRIFNPRTDAPLAVTLHFLPRGIDGTNIPGQIFTIPAGGTLVLDNAAHELLPSTIPAVGAIRIDSDIELSYPFVAGSRTYTQSPDVTRPGTYGQFVPALAPAEATVKSVLLHVVSTPEYRTNIGAMNPGSAAVTVTMKVLGTDGSSILDSIVKTVPAKSMDQWSLLELFGGFYAPDATVIVEASAPVFTWASVIDNLSGDAIFVRGLEHDATIGPIE